MKVLLTLSYVMGDSPVRHTEAFTVIMNQDVFAKLDHYGTKLDTLRKMYGHMVLGRVVDGYAAIISREDAVSTVEPIDFSYFRGPILLLPFKILWTILKFLFETTH